MCVIYLAFCFCCFCSVRWFVFARSQTLLRSLSAGKVVPFVLVVGRVAMLQVQQPPSRNKKNPPSAELGMFPMFLIPKLRHFPTALLRDRTLSKGWKIIAHARWPVVTDGLATVF